MKDLGDEPIIWVSRFLVIDHVAFLVCLKNKGLQTV